MPSIRLLGRLTLRILVSLVHLFAKPKKICPGFVTFLHGMLICLFGHTNNAVIQVSPHRGNIKNVRT
jgi:hypothetical protein